MSQLPPVTIHVTTKTDGVWWCYDTTGQVQFADKWTYSFVPSRIHHYLPSNGSRLFLFIIETTSHRERILVRANDPDEARLRFNGWAEGQREIKVDSLSVREVFE